MEGNLSAPLPVHDPTSYRPKEAIERSDYLLILSDEMLKLNLPSQNSQFTNKFS